MSRSSPRRSIRTIRPRNAVVVPYDADVDMDNSTTDSSITVQKADFRRWDFNVFLLETPPAQLDFVIQLSRHFNLHDEFGIQETQMDLFFLDVQRGYEHTLSIVTRQYHTFLHAVDVMQSVAVFLRGFEGHRYIQPISAASLLIASLCHDIGHIGLTNQYLINSGHPLTLEYRTPVLESMHCAKTMALIKHHGFLKNLQIHESLRISKTIARCILFTDVSIHSDLLRKVKALPHPKDVYFDEHSIIYCGFLLHTADICNPAKEWSLATKWTSLIMSEFFEQGALERKEGFVVSAFRNADLINTSEIQANFVRLMLQPTLALLTDMLPQAAPLLCIAEANRIRWEAESKRSFSPGQVNLVRGLARSLSLRNLGPYQIWLDRIHRWITSKYAIGLLFSALIYATFADVIRLAFLPVSCDSIVGFVTFLVLFYLLVEISMTIIVVQSYRWSLYFWMDFITTITLVSEIPFLAFTSHSIQPLERSTREAKAIVTRLFRVLRLVRMCTLFKTFKEIVIRRMYEPRRQHAPTLPDAPTFTFTLEDVKRIFPNQIKITSTQMDQFVRSAYRGYPPPPLALKNFCSRFAASNCSSSTNGLTIEKFHQVLCDLEVEYDREVNADNKISQLNLYASRLGERVADATIRHVMFLLLALLIILSEIPPHYDTLSPAMFGLRFLHEHAMDGLMDISEELKLYGNSTKPLHLYIPHTNNTLIDTICSSFNKNYFNSNDLAYLNTSQDGSYLYLTQSISYRNSDLNLIYYPDTCIWESPTIPCQSIVILDISIQSKERALSELFQIFFIFSCFCIGGILLTMDVYKRVIIPIDRMVSMTQQLAMNPCKSVRQIHDNQPMYELTLLQHTLTKIARLLQIGYGSAGSAIISKNMMGAEFNPIIPGKRVHAVFGFCDIRQFTDITECLQEKVMSFTNTIGSIVHHAAYTFNGHANKNVGDAFLLVWTISDDSPDISIINQAKPPNHLIQNKSSEVEFLFFDEEGSKKMQQSTGWIATIADNALMAFLKTMVDIDHSIHLKTYRTDKRLESRFLLPFTVKMGYGLHVGWAIDGAIGSKYKIDASYLSSDVNMTSLLESTTKLYQVPLIMSHSFYNLLSPAIQQFCRCIDCVWFDGVDRPIALYTCDYSTPKLKEFYTINDILKLQQHLPNNFLNEFENGIKLYFNGKWKDAKNIFELLPKNDGPTNNILEYMKKYNYISPSEWLGYRHI